MVDISMQASSAPLASPVMLNFVADKSHRDVCKAMRTLTGAWDMGSRLDTIFKLERGTVEDRYSVALHSTVALVSFSTCTGS